MDFEQHYQSWKKQRSSVNVPDDFAGQVLGQIERRGELAPTAPSRETAEPQTAWSRVGKFSLGLAACLVFMIRIAHLFAVFIAS